MRNQLATHEGSQANVRSLRVPTRPDREELAASLRGDPDDKLLADLIGANLTKANLIGANLTQANLSQANLSQANLSQANLSQANLTQANLSQANLTQANLTQANLLLARLREANLREANLTQANLSQANLTHARLHEANLIGTNLSRANLIGANLSRANLREANLFGASLFGANLSRFDLSGARLSGANLIETNLTQANLREANLSQANLIEANLREANLREANLTQANLTQANLTQANLTHANLTQANLTQANLTHANLIEANLSSANLSEADFSRANLRGACLSDVTLPGSVRQAELLGAHVDWRTVALSLRLPDLQTILVRTGMPEVVAIYLIDSVRSIDEVDLFTMLQSVFLSYGSPDAEFAERLRNDLTRNGVKTWFFPKDAVPGARLQRHLQDQINSYDRLILCCSEASLQRTGVLHEVEEVLEREQDEGGAEILIPIMLDPIFDTGKTPPPWWPEGKEHIYLSLRRRVAADFRGVMDDPDRWSEQLGRVVAALRKRPEQAKPG